MPDPTVCAILLVNGRPEMVKRAVRSFDAQTYANKAMLILNTTPESEGLLKRPQIAYSRDDVWAPRERADGRTIGALRNHANILARMVNTVHGQVRLIERAGVPDILCHWDSDDWSHPRRIEEQVALLQSSGKQCVGYRDMLFWDTRPSAFCGAYVYHNDHPAYVIGSSMMYWRTAWEACPFDDAPHEDQRWWLKNKSQCAAVGSIYPDCQPRMICAIHGGNTSTSYRPEVMKLPAWRRAPEWDAHCGSVMQL